MRRAVETFKRSLTKIRIGRAHVAILDGVSVNYYGTLTPLNQIATVHVVDARLITVKPWDARLLNTIIAALQQASDSIGIPSVAGDLVRIPIPPLTQDRRKVLAKVASKHAESARVGVRAIRRAALDEIEGMSEDQRHRSEKQIQALIDKYIDVVNVLAKDKESEILYA